MDQWLILLGCAGGALPDVIRIIQNRHQNELPDYVYSLDFWIGFLLLGYGGLAVWFGAASDAKEALAYGFGAPEIISRLLSSPPITLRDTTDRIRRWRILQPFEAVCCRKANAAADPRRTPAIFEQALDATLATSGAGGRSGQGGRLHRARRKGRQLSGFPQHLVDFRRVHLFRLNHLPHVLFQRHGAIRHEGQQFPV